MKDRIHDLSIEVLIRLWFRLLWQKFDLGGISVGRSLRCDLLDCYLDFTPLRDFADGADAHSDGLDEKILRRPLVEPLGLVVLEDIPRYTKEQVALAGLGALLALEWSVHADIAWNGGYEWERQRMRDVLARFAYLQVPPEATAELVNSIARALLERKRHLEHEEYSGFFLPLSEE